MTTLPFALYEGLAVLVIAVYAVSQILLAYCFATCMFRLYSQCRLLRRQIRRNPTTRGRPQ